MTAEARHLEGHDDVTRVIDQEARDLAREAIAEIRQHAAVCTEAEKRREEGERRREEADKRREEWLARIQTSYEANSTSLHAALTKAVEGLRGEATKSCDDQADVNKDLYTRFWGIAIAYAGSMTVLALFLAGKLLHIIS